MQPCAETTESNSARLSISRSWEAWWDWGWACDRASAGRVSDPPAHAEHAPGSALDRRRVHPHDLEGVAVDVVEGPSVHEAVVLVSPETEPPAATAFSTSSSTFSRLSALSAISTSLDFVESTMSFFVNWRYFSGVCTITTMVSLSGIDAVVSSLNWALIS